MSTEQNNNEERDDGSTLLDTRGAVILLMAVFSATVIAALTYTATHSTPQALIAAIFAFAGTVLFGMKIIR